MARELPLSLYSFEKMGNKAFLLKLYFIPPNVTLGGFFEIIFSRVFFTITNLEA